VAELQYTTDKPTKPGWYWCRNQGDYPGQVWEAVVRVDCHGTIGPDGGAPDGLCLSWMSSTGNVGVLHEREWSDEAEWAGPISPPTNTCVFRGRPVKGRDNDDQI
jgi:hypothetical protein